MLKKHGWRFNWKAMNFNLKDRQLYELVIKGKDVIQGMLESSDSRKDYIEMSFN